MPAPATVPQPKAPASQQLRDKVQDYKRELNDKASFELSPNEGLEIFVPGKATEEQARAIIKILQ